MTTVEFIPLGKYTLLPFVLAHAYEELTGKPYQNDRFDPVMIYIIKHAPQSIIGPNFIQTVELPPDQTIKFDMRGFYSVKGTRPTYPPLPCDIGERFDAIKRRYPRAYE